MFHFLQLQEADCIQQLNKADVLHVSRTVQLLVSHRNLLLVILIWFKAFHWSAEGTTMTWNRMFFFRVLMINSCARKRIQDEGGEFKSALISAALHVVSIALSTRKLSVYTDMRVHVVH